MTCYECGSGVRPAPPHPQAQGRGEGRLRTVTLDLRREVRTPWHAGCFRPAGREAARCLPGFAGRLCWGRTASPRERPPKNAPPPSPQPPVCTRAQQGGASNAALLAAPRRAECRVVLRGSEPPPRCDSSSWRRSSSPGTHPAPTGSHALLSMLKHLWR